MDPGLGFEFFWSRHNVIMQPVAKIFFGSKVSRVKTECPTAMQPFGLNHMTTPTLSVFDLLAMAARLGCSGVELRNDLPGPLFDGHDGADIAGMARDLDLDILGLAQVGSFNHPDLVHFDDAKDLLLQAASCGAKGVALIPHMGAELTGRAAQRTLLKAALQKFQPLFEDLSLIGMIEPLGFANSSLRHCEDVARILDDMNRPACFSMIHDTFHYHLAGGGALFPEHVGLVHISGVEISGLALPEMRDAHRVLVGPLDRLGNARQICGLRAGGYAGALSFEAFAPTIHHMRDPETALRGSIDFISSHAAAIAA